MKKYNLFLLFFLLLTCRVVAQGAVDSDGDSVADHLDLDDDNDGVLDTDEGKSKALFDAGWFGNYNSNKLTQDGYWPEPSSNLSAIVQNSRNSTIVASTTAVTYGSGLTVTLPGSTWNVSAIDAITLAQAKVNNEYFEYRFTTPSVLADFVEFGCIGFANSNFVYHLGVEVSINGGIATPLVNDFTIPVGSYQYQSNYALLSRIRLQPSTTYTFRVYFFNAPSALTNLQYDDFQFGTITSKDTDNDGTPDYLDLDSDNDGCADANEYYNDKTKAGTDNRYGSVPRTVDTNGKVIGASYSGNYNPVIAIGDAVSIGTQPLDKIIDVGNSISFTANATTLNGNLAYQWQISTDNGVIWADIANAGVYSGATTATLVITNATKSLDAYKYRLKVVNQNNVCQDITSNEALLDILPKASDDTECYVPNRAHTVYVLTNDNTGDSPVASTIIITMAGASADGKNYTVTGQGVWTVNNTNGTITFTPIAGFNSNPTPIAYTVKDNEGSTSNSATITITATSAPNVNISGSTPRATY